MRPNPLEAIVFGSVFALAAGVSACAQTVPVTETSPIASAAEPGIPTEAGGQIIGSGGATIGEYFMQQAANGLLLTVTIEQGSLTPGWHGLHLHAVGDCSDVGVFKLSGGHVGKIEGGHGLLNPLGPEEGDLPNIWAAADGSAGMQAFTTLVDLQTLLDEDGTALIIHAEEDDHITQPIGGAGARVACAVIGAN
ncbi:MAG: superoxide dismutase family protein [Pseudomonadota bacterium]